MPRSMAGTTRLLGPTVNPLSSMAALLKGLGLDADAATKRPAAEVIEGGHIQQCVNSLQTVCGLGCRRSHKMPCDRGIGGVDRYGVDRLSVFSSDADEATKLPAKKR
jgi:hypothetical protein